MKHVALLIATFLMMPSPLHAQGIGDAPLFLECGGIGTQPVDHDPDPVYKINIALVPRDGHISHVDVRFTTVSGMVYVRGNQYSGIMISEGVEGAMPVINWYGRWNKNPNVMMMGRIWRNGVRAGYNEMRQDGPAVTMVMVSRCHFIDDPDPKGD